MTVLYLKFTHSYHWRNLLYFYNFVSCKSLVMTSYCSKHVAGTPQVIIYYWLWNSVEEIEYNLSIAQYVVYICFLLIFYIMCLILGALVSLRCLLKSPIIPSKDKRKYWLPSVFIGSVSVSVFNVYRVKIGLWIFTLVPSHFMLFGGSKGKASYWVALHAFLACVLTDSLFVERCFRLSIYLQALPTFSARYSTYPLTFHIWLHTTTYSSHITSHIISHIHIHFTFYFTHSHAFLHIT